MVGKYNNREQWNRCAALGVTNYGQFTAGGWFYIGSQGIVHGTYSTFLAAARQILHKSSEEVLRGNLLVSAGLGGMSGAQGKAIELCQGVGIIAEVDASKIELRMRLGWIKAMVHTPQEAFVLQKSTSKKETYLHWIPWKYGGPAGICQKLSRKLTCSQTRPPVMWHLMAGTVLRV